nr:EOG090X028A [Artemia franciscana]
MNHRYRQEFIEGKAKHRSCPFTRADLILSSQDWSSIVVGKLSNYINVDSICPSTRENYEQQLLQELAYASHLGIPAILLPLKGPKQTNLARTIYSKLTGSQSTEARYSVWMQVPMKNTGNGENHEDEEEKAWENETWHWWNYFRQVADFNKKIGIALEISEDLPSHAAISRWLGEPIKAFLVPTYLFLTNKKGYPVLSKPHQQLVKNLFRIKAQGIITGSLRHTSMKHYQEYMEFLFKQSISHDPLKKFGQGYEDYLQYPLQPLMDNLESNTYEIFEKDPVKYREYQNAIRRALQDKSKEEKYDGKTLVVTVVGAGRGPLVRASLNAAAEAEVDIKVYAVEKNPNAVITLQLQEEEIWGDKVTVVSCDMREWNPTELTDILVSELLGSFGDNELSPECLDGAQRFLKPDGISIPCDYTSFLAPIHSPKLYNEVRSCREVDKPPHTPFEMPFVVQLHNKMDLASAQPLFKFEHPNLSTNIDNSRYKILQFQVESDATLHGLAGYFECTLYKDVMLSINPATHSEGMFSWFPILFPIKIPIQVHSGDVIEIHFWRKISRTHVWYEWCVASPSIVAVHNPNGRSYSIGL